MLLRNYAVCLCRRACYMDLGGDGIKVASKLFQQAAWIFEQLMTMSSQLPPGVASTDFNKETLVMNSNLCLAQAQYLFFKMASDKNMPPTILSKVAAQVSIYFQKAHDNNQTNSSLRAHESGKFANVLGYHSRYFLAQAYWVLGQQAFTQAGDAGKGMNMAVAYLTVAVEKFTEAKPYVNQLGGAYQANF